MSSASDPPTSEMASLTVEAKKGTAKRDTLRANEIHVQKLWEEAKVFEADPDPSRESFLVTFPYPYSNGHLHIGHGFSLTKAMFRAQFERHQGKNVLFPFAFHCTGMPIQAAANKLKTEIEQFGCPPCFPEEDAQVRAQMEEEMAQVAAATATKDKSKIAGRVRKIPITTGAAVAKALNGTTTHQEDAIAEEVMTAPKTGEEIPSRAD